MSGGCAGAPILMWVDLSRACSCLIRAQLALLGVAADRDGSLIDRMAAVVFFDRWPCSPDRRTKSASGRSRGLVFLGALALARVDRFGDCLWAVAGRRGLLLESLPTDAMFVRTSVADPSQDRSMSSSRSQAA